MAIEFTRFFRIHIYVVLEHALVIFIIFEMTLKLYLIPLTIVVITEEELT